MKRGVASERCAIKSKGFISTVIHFPKLKQVWITSVEPNIII